MFGKKKSHKQKDKDNESKPSKSEVSKSDKKKEHHKEEKKELKGDKKDLKGDKKEHHKTDKKSSSNKDKDKRCSVELKADPGYSWLPSDSKSHRDKSSSSHSGNSSGKQQKPFKVTGHQAKTPSKYSPQNLNLVKPTSLYDAKQSDKKKDKDKKATQPESNGILKSKLPKKNGVSFPGSQVVPLYRLPTNQVTFAGPDNRVHQSVVNVSNSPRVKPKQSFHPSDNGYIHDINGKASYGTPQQAGRGNSYNLVHPFFKRLDFNSTPMPDPQEITSEHVNHYCISHGQQTKHVTSINVNSKTSVQLPEKLPAQKQNSNERSNIMRKPVSKTSSSPLPASNNESILASSGEQQNTDDVTKKKSIPNGSVKQTAPVVLAEINIPSRIVAPSDNKTTARHQDDSEIPKPNRNSNSGVQYAELMFPKQDQNKPLEQSASSGSLDKTERKQTIIKGILKPPAPIKRRVEFNNEVDINLFNTLSTLSSRHQSLESLSIFDEDAVARDHYMMQDRYDRPPPLDDTDLYMYTLRKNRISSPGKHAHNGTVSYRHRPPPQYWRGNPWMSSATGRYQPHVVRTVRMVPPAGGGGRHNEWMW